MCDGQNAPPNIKKVCLGRSSFNIHRILNFKIFFHFFFLAIQCIRRIQFISFSSKVSETPFSRRRVKNVLTIETLLRENYDT